MNRRAFLRRAGAASAAVALPLRASLLAQDPPPAGWRTFEVTTRVSVMSPAGPTRVWLPMPLIAETPFQKTLHNASGASNGGHVSFHDDRALTTAMIMAEWPEGAAPVLSSTSRVAVRDYATDLTAPARTDTVADRAGLARYLQPSRFLPIDGIVKTTADSITGRARTDVEKARAIYEWIVDNTFRDPAVRGCGLGDIRFMLESRNLGGKCADLNALYVGLARAAGLPARDVYGVRVAPSERGFKSLGAASPNVTKAQHCRAEVFLAGYGWTPVDPADVRKVVLEEPPGGLALDSEPVTRARARLFGSWEMNWIAYNFGHDVTLPGSAHGRLPFLMYPQCETANGRLDPLDPDHFHYDITAQEARG
ncbi:MAG TPA: transglutaminase-like domain-containing protein [Vicinamibacterales bacterium]|nr:transglutaminase-like domain-containing protein [Vicinamibacterales bacterium]